MEQAADWSRARAVRDDAGGHRHHVMEMNWKFFIGASILAGGLMLKVAPIWAVATGLALAAAVNWYRHQGGMSKRP